MRRWSRGVAGMLAATALAVPSAALAQSDPFDPAREEANYAKGAERERYEAGLPADDEARSSLGSRQQAALVQTLAADPERNPTNICGLIRLDACLGDIRLWDFAPDHGIRHPVLFTARNGATLSGNLWATRDGPAKRPAVVFVTGSVQVPEPAYWFAPIVLAKRGYVVISFDEQGEGLSDTRGEGVDSLEGVPAQSGRPFYDGAEDALDFLLSTPERRYVPRPSCTTGTSHDAKQQRRVEAGLNAPFNPLWDLVDPERIGMAGQSLGAAAASLVGQIDPRVDAIVGLDNLQRPSPRSGIDCPSAPETRRVVKPTKPGLGISNDYGIFPSKFTKNPGPNGKLGASLTYTEAGVDSAQIVIRGGTHQECAYIPLRGIRATLRGYQLCGWYLAAWMDKYLKRDPTADRRLFSRRWLDDARDAEIDPAGKGNLMSFYYRSRMDVRLTGGDSRATCEELRSGKCRWMTDADGWRGAFDIDALAHTPDGDGGPIAFEPKLRDGRVPIPARSILRGRSRRGAVSISASARGSAAGDVERFEVQERRGRRWVTRGLRLEPGRARSLPTRPGRSRRLRVRAVDRLGGGGAWSRSVLLHSRR